MSSQTRTILRKSISDRVRAVKTAITSAISALPFFKKIQKRYAYSAAKKTGQNGLWSPQNLSSDASILPCSELIKAKARDAARNNAFVLGSLAKIVNNIVGSVLNVQFLFTKADGELDDVLNDVLELRLKAWCRSAMMDGGSFTELARILVHTVHVDGEILVGDVLDPRIKAGNPYRVQLFETDYLDPKSGCYGIDYDEYGAATKFHLFEVNPSDNVNTLSQIQHKYAGKTRTVLANAMRLVRYRTRSSGYRGISELASIINGIYSLDQLQSAELNAMRSSQAFGLIITSPYAQDIAAGMGVEAEDSDDTEEREELVSIPNPGGVGYLNPGEKAETVKSDRPNSNFVGFVKLLLRYFGAGLKSSYSEVSNDYSEGSYSSQRQEMLTVERIYRAKQSHLDEELRNIVANWLKYEVLFVGVPGLSASRLVNSPENFEKFHVCFPGFPWIDPEKGMAALKMEIAEGLKTRSDATAETYGTDWQSNVKQLAREKKQMQKLGLIDNPVPSTELKGLYKWLT